MIADLSHLEYHGNSFLLSDPMSTARYLYPIPAMVEPRRPSRAVGVLEHSKHKLHQIPPTTRTKGLADASGCEILGFALRPLFIRHRIQRPKIVYHGLHLLMAEHWADHY
ncbi:hypothetical protein OSJ57_17675 [Sphingomonas sp. HH69]